MQGCQPLSGPGKSLILPEMPLLHLESEGLGSDGLLRALWGSETLDIKHLFRQPEKCGLGRSGRDQSPS